MLKKIALSLILLNTCTLSFSSSPTTGAKEKQKLHQLIDSFRKENACKNSLPRLRPYNPPAYDILEERNPHVELKNVGKDQYSLAMESMLLDTFELKKMLKKRIGYRKLKKEITAFELEYANYKKESNSYNTETKEVIYNLKYGSILLCFDDYKWHIYGYGYFD